MRTASGLAMLVLVLVLIAVGGAALKLLTDRQSMATMIDDYGQSLSAIPMPPGPAVQAFTSAQQRAGAGDYTGARSDLERGMGLVREAPIPPTTPQPPPGGDQPRGPSPEELERAVEELPETVRPFFRERPELLRQAMMLRLRAQRSVPPEEMEKQTQRIIEAASAGDEEAVKSVLAELRGKLGPVSPQGRQGPGGRMPGRRPRGAGEARGQVQQWITQARQILSRARQAGANTKQASELVNRAEGLLAQGKEREAAEKMEEAMQHLRGVAANAQRRPRGAPRAGGARMARRPGGPGGLRGPGGPGGPAGPGAMPGFLGALLGHMRSESAAIFGAMEDIETAGLALLEKNQDQVREILSSATDKLKAVGKGRSELDKNLQQMQRAPRAAPGGARPRGPRSAQGPRQPRPGQPGPPSVREPALDPRRVHDLLGRALDEVRTLSPDEYEKQREEMIGRIVVSLMRPPDEQIALSPGEAPRPTGIGLPPLELPAEEPTNPAERDKLREQVRERMRLLHEPYLMLTNAGVEMEQVEHLIRQAREAFTADKLVDAGKSVNHASDLIWPLMQIHRADLEPLAREGETTTEPVAEEAPSTPEAETRP